METDAGHRQQFSVRHLTRRRFLLLSGAALVGAACETRPAPSPGPSGGDGTASASPPTPTASPDVAAEPPFSVWRELRERLRASPDHLAARAEMLVANGDPEEISRFVAEEVATLPSQEDGFSHAETAVRWGPRATLRCGAGTPREKAELLAELLTAAGASSRVATAELRADLTGRADLLFRPIARQFAPNVDDQTLDVWLRQLAITGPVPPMKVLDPQGADSRALAADIVPLLTASTAAPFDRRVKDRIPVVVTRVRGVETIANPLVADDPLGSQTVSGTPVVALPPSGLRNVTLQVLVARSDDPNNRIAVVEGTWTADDLVGRMIQVSFAPVGGIAALAGRSIEEVSLFTPVLAVRGADVDAATTTRLARAGKTISTGGRILDDLPDGTPLVDEQPLAATPSNSAGAASVAGLEAAVRAETFPTVRLTLSPRDASGQIVEGLGAADIRVEEEGRAAAFIMASNQPRPPRVVLLLDSSRSIPSAFRGSKAAALGRKLAAGVVAEHPAAEFLVAGVNYGTVTPSGTWASDPAVVEANVSSVPGEGSDLWMALGEATALGASVIVLVTDGDATDPPAEIARARPRIAGGPPVVVVGVGAKQTSAIDAWVSLSGGTYLPVEDVDAAVKGVTGALTAIQRSPYRLEYVTRRDGPSRRTVRATIGGIQQELTYDVPPAAQRVAAPALVGLYLRIRVAGQGEITRTLAGLDHSRLHRRGDPVPEAVTDEVLGGLFGGVLLAVEAGTPTLAAWLDGFLAAKGSLAPLWAAARANDVRGMLDAMIEATPLPPAVLLPLTGALPGEDDGSSVTFPAGLRCVLYTERPIFGAGTRRSVDILPTARWLTAADDRREAFALTLERTARLAVGEAALFGTSTAARLAGRPLELLPAGTPAPRSGPLADQARLLDEYVADDRLVPTDAGAFAFWVVRRDTGELLGILPDGSGGGSGLEGEHIIDKTAAALGLAGSFAGFGFAFGAFLALQKAIAKSALVLAAWILTIGGEGEGGNPGGSNPDFGPPWKKLGCDLAKSGLGAIYPPYGAISKLDKIGTLTGHPLIPCP